MVLFPSSSDATTFALKTFVSLTFAQIYSGLNSDNVVSRALLKIKLECLSVTDTHTPYTNILRVRLRAHYMSETSKVPVTLTNIGLG